jgi:hypothetical protein
VRLPGSAMAGRDGGVRREVGRLIGLVLLVHMLFIAAYYVAGLATASERARFAYMLIWTATTLTVVLIGLGRVRAARTRRHRPD